MTLTKPGWAPSPECAATTNLTTARTLTLSKEKPGHGTDETRVGHPAQTTASPAGHPAHRRHHHHHCHGSGASRHLTVGLLLQSQGRSGERE